MHICDFTLNEINFWQPNKTHFFRGYISTGFQTVYWGRNSVLLLLIHETTCQLFSWKLFVQWDEVSIGTTVPGSWDAVPGKTLLYKRRKRRNILVIEVNRPLQSSAARLKCVSINIYKNLLQTIIQTFETCGEKEMMLLKLSCVCVCAYM